MNHCAMCWAELTTSEHEHKGAGRMFCTEACKTRWEEIWPLNFFPTHLAGEFVNGT